jgi:hypothetical protein
MLLHLVSLCVRQPSGFEKDTIGQGELAEIVQRGKFEDALNGGVIEIGDAGCSQMLCDQAGVARHTVHVRAGFRIAVVNHVVGCLDGSGKNPDGEHLGGHDCRDQMSVHVERAKRRFRKLAGRARVEEDKSPE